MHTAEQYASCLIRKLGKDSEVVDIFVIPDYQIIFDKCIDPKFKNYCKEEFTQHQFIFVAVPISDEFPFGCKTTYRSYAQSDVVEIFEELNEFYPTVNLIPYNVKVITQPVEDKQQGIPEGK